MSETVGTYWREVWALRGPYFSLPLSIEWPGGQHDVAAIRIGAGLRLLDIQRQAAEARLLAIGGECDARGINGKRWWLFRPQLEEFCVPHGQVDPETVLEWRLPTKIRYSKPNNAQRRMRDEFFHEFCKGGLIQNPHKAEFWYTAFCKFMLYWLVNQQRPVDLGFCQLVPVPLRVNWKSLLLAKHIGQKISMAHLLREVAAHVLGPKFTAWDRTRNHIFWTLEALPLKAWNVATVRYERGRRKLRLHQRERYTGAIRDSIKRALPYITQLYAAYLSRVKKAGAHLADERRPQGKAPPRASKRGKYVWVAPADVVHPAYDVRRAAPVADVELSDTDEADSRVREMPDLPPELEDMRQSRIEVEEPANQP